MAHTYEACKDFITDSFWIGKLRGWNTRVKLDDATEADICRFVEPLKKASSDEIVKQMYRTLDGKPFIRWKDSISDIVK